MDKILIALGAYLLWKAVNNEANEVIQTGDDIINTKGFLGILIIFGILFSFAQYVPKYTWISSSLASIIMLGFWATK